MRKKPALTLLLIMAITLLHSSSAPYTADREVSMVNSISFTHAAAPSSIYYQSEDDGSCEKALTFFLSLPAKCLTADGLKVAVPKPPQVVSIPNIK